MAVERTLSIIKPDATRRNLTGEIVARFEKAGLRVVAQKRMRLTRQQAEAFYARPQGTAVLRRTCRIYDIRSGRRAGPSRRGRVAKNREVMGATNPEEGRPRHHPQGFRREHRGELGARLRCAGDGRQRNPLLLQRPRNRRLINRPVGASDTPRRPSRSGRSRIRVSAPEAHRRAVPARTSRACRASRCSTHRARKIRAAVSDLAARAHDDRSHRARVQDRDALLHRPLVLDQHGDIEPAVAVEIALQEIRIDAGRERIGRSETLLAQDRARPRRKVLQLLPCRLARRRAGRKERDSSHNAEQAAAHDQGCSLSRARNVEPSS